MVGVVVVGLESRETPGPICGTSLARGAIVGVEAAEPSGPSGEVTSGVSELGVPSAVQTASVAKVRIPTPSPTAIGRTERRGRVASAGAAGVAASRRRLLVSSAVGSAS